MAEDIQQQLAAAVEALRPKQEQPKAEPSENAAPEAAKAEAPEAAEPAKAPAPKTESPKPQQDRPRREDRPPRPPQEARGERKPDERKGEDRGPRGGGDRRPGGDRGGERREGPRPGGGRSFEMAPDIELEKLISDSLYLDNQAHAVVARMRDMDSGTKSQLRRLYNAVRRAVRAPEAQKQHQFVMLRARLAYTIARHSLRSLDALERLLLQVTRRNDARGYERFKDLFEAIVAYNE
jgi:CRISPR type III-A-associated protein Csm2